MRGMNVCYFGDYAADYPRHWVLQTGLRQAGVTVTECRLKTRGLRVYLELLWRVRQIPADTDVILVGYSNSRFIWWLRVLTRKPIVWNAFYSLYDNWVFDRKRVAEGSLRATFLWYLDYWCARAADRVILETEADIAYWCQTFKLPRSTFIHSLLGYDERIIQPTKVVPDTTTFTVHFHGWYIPLQGVDTIVRAAKLLETYTDIKCNLIGSGQTYAAVQSLAAELEVHNITFLPPQPMTAIVLYMAAADVCIGLVGDVSRVDRANANKLFEAAGMRRAAINADAAAVRELFTHEKDVLLIPRGDAEALAAAIVRLYKDPVLKQSLAAAAYETVTTNASTKAIGTALKKDLLALLGRD